jgi:SAM-dependent methyltransferase
MSQEHYTRIADVYDTFVKSDYDVAFFTQEARQAGGEILELMAGTGRLTMPLLEAGIPLTAVDYSPEMLAILRQKLEQRGFNAHVEQADIRHMALNRRFKQIIIPFQAFPELTTEDDQRQALECIREHLDTDGTFICTLHNPAVRLKTVDNQLRLVGQHALDDGGELHVWLLQRRGPNPYVVEVLEYFETYDPHGVMRSKRYSRLQFHLLEQEIFERLIAQTGFEVVHLYGDYAYAPFDDSTSPVMIWILKQSQDSKINL